MLVELYVKNLAVIEELRLELGTGLTVLSGDEGAGKSLLVDALSLLLGGRASTSLIRTGALAALVEGVFWTKPDDSVVGIMLKEAGIEPEGDGMLILTREVQEQGRSVARVNGRVVAVSLLRALGQRLMDIHTQMEHLSLLSVQRQLDLLDSFGGLLELRSNLGEKVSQLREKARELGLTAGESMQRQREFLEYQIAELDGANVCAGQDESLQQERHILQRARELKEGCSTAYSMLYTDDDHAAVSLTYQAIKAVQRLVSIDPTLQPHLESLEITAAALEETARALCRYAEAVESGAGHFEEVEERLEVLRRLKSKYGPTLEDVVQFAVQARNDLENLLAQEERRCQLEEQHGELKREAGELAEKLSQARQEAAQGLTEAVNVELDELGIPWAKFDIKLTREECPDGLSAYQGMYAFSQYGIDRVEFMGSTNPAEPLRPLADIVSGGEICRFMLALKSALRRADLVPTLVFDEIDSGIAGRNAETVGRKLSTLAKEQQVICVTHLPQVACFGDNHYRVIKEVSSGRAATRIEHLGKDSRVGELAAMMGSSGDKLMFQSAREFLSRADQTEKNNIISVIS